MKINELSRVTHVNSETIRMYRNMGFLLPRQRENGYYDYSEADLQTLLFIRKLRGMNLSLDTVSETLNRADLEEMVSGCRSELEALDQEILRLQKRRDMLRTHVNFYEVYHRNLLRVAEEQIEDDRYDLLFETKNIRPELDIWLTHIGLFTQGIYMNPDLLRSDELPSQIPVELTIGSFSPILEDNGFPVPSDAIFTPRGSYLTTSLELREGDDSLDQSQLLPLLKYAEAHKLCLTGENTAFLFRVDHSKGLPVFTYRFRARIIPNVE